jgi:phage tail-like protein
MARNDPLRNFRYKLSIDSINIASFSEVAIADTTTDAIEYREGDEPTHVRKMPGLNKYGNITLKKGITSSLELYNWHNQVLTNQIRDVRRKVQIDVWGEDDDQPKATFVVREAWPIKYDPSDLNAKGNEVLIETLELANEGIERTK